MMRVRAISVMMAVAVALFATGCSRASDAIEPPVTQGVATPSPSSGPSAPPDLVEEGIWHAPVDGGPREGAMGEVTLDADGEPTSYTVASGDTADQIRMRFNIWWDQLQ